MANKNYQRGVRFERAVMSELTVQKYIVMRTAGSHGVADIIAINEDHIRLIQAKSTMTFLSLAAYRKDIEKFNSFLPENVISELWIKPDRKEIIKVLIF